MRNCVAVVTLAVAFAAGSAFADDKTPPQPVDQQRLKQERAKAKAEKAMRQKKDTDDPYGSAPMRTPKGTPLVGDFDRPRPTPEEQRRALESQRLQGGFGPPAGRAEKQVAPNPAPNDPSKKGPGQ